MRKFRAFWGAIRDFWRNGKAGVALFLISLIVLIYGYIAFNYELGQGWNGHKSLQNVLKDISIFIPVGAALVAMIIGGIDIIMLLSDWYIDRREKRIQAAKVEGEDKVWRMIEEWQHRKAEAERRGEEFTEPPPARPQPSKKKE